MSWNLPCVILLLCFPLNYRASYATNLGASRVRKTMLLNLDLLKLIRTLSAEVAPDTWLSRKDNRGWANHRIHTLSGHMINLPQWANWCTHHVNNRLTQWCYNVYDLHWRWLYLFSDYCNDDYWQVGHFCGRPPSLQLFHCLFIRRQAGGAGNWAKLKDFIASSTTGKISVGPYVCIELLHLHSYPSSSRALLPGFSLTVGCAIQGNLESSPQHSRHISLKLAA